MVAANVKVWLPLDTIEKGIPLVGAVTVLIKLPAKYTSEIVTDAVPVFLIKTDTVSAVESRLSCPKETCSVCMNPVLSEPIHTATAMLTATVTAMSMIDATTGLRAFAFFRIFLRVFIFVFFPPLELKLMRQKD